MVSKIKEILKIPIQKLDKPIFLLKETQNSAARNRKMLVAFNGKLGAVIVAQKAVH